MQQNNYFNNNVLSSFNNTEQQTNRTCSSQRQNLIRQDQSQNNQIIQSQENQNNNNLAETSFNLLSIDDDKKYQESDDVDYTLDTNIRTKSKTSHVPYNNKNYQKKSKIQNTNNIQQQQQQQKLLNNNHVENILCSVFNPKNIQHSRKKSLNVIGKIKKHAIHPLIQQGIDKEQQKQLEQKGQLINKGNSSDFTALSPKQKIEYKQWHFIQILGKVKIFMKKMMLTRPGQSFSQLSKNHINMIGDKSYYFLDKNTRRGIFNEEFQEKIRYSFIITPQTQWITLWKVLIFFTVMTQMFILPLKSSFQFNFTEGWLLYVFYIFPITCLILDMILSFNTSYFSEGIQVTCRIQIIKEYMKLKFWVDLITISSLFLQLGSGDNIIYMFIYLLKLLTVMEIYHEIDEQYEIEYRFPTATTIFSLVYMLLMFAHYAGSMFHLIAFQYEEEGSWLDVYELRDQSKMVRYLNSLYFAFITMSTVGYGDISPQTVVEKVYILIVTLISCFVFSYTVNTIGSLFQERAQRIAQLKQQTYDVANYMKNRGISKEVQNSVRKYLHYIQNTSTSKTAQGQEILNVISKKLKECVYLEFYGSIIRQSKLFKFNFSPQFLDKVALVMKEKVVGPEEMIFSANDRDNRIYFIKTGQIEIFLDQNNPTQSSQIVEGQTYQYDVRETGEIFGDRGFFGQIPREYNAKSNKTSHLVYIQYEEILQILKQFPNDYQKFCQIRDNILLTKQTSSERCSCCDYKYSHSIINCPYLHFARNKHFLIQKFNFSISIEERTKKKRSKNKTYHSLKQNCGIRDLLRQLRRDIVYDIEEDYELSDIQQDLEKNDKQFYMTTPQIVLKDGGVYIESSDDLDQIQEQTEEEDNEYFIQKPLYMQDIYHQQEYDYTIQKQQEDEEYLEENSFNQTINEENENSSISESLNFSNPQQQQLSNKFLNPSNNGKLQKTLKYKKSIIGSKNNLSYQKNNNNNNNKSLNSLENIKRQSSKLIINEDKKQFLENNIKNSNIKQSLLDQNQILDKNMKKHTSILLKSQNNISQEEILNFNLEEIGVFNNNQFDNINSNRLLELSNDVLYKKKKKKETILLNNFQINEEGSGELNCLESDSIGLTNTNPIQNRSLKNSYKNINMNKKRKSSLLGDIQLSKRNFGSNQITQSVRQKTRKRDSKKINKIYKNFLMPYIKNQSNNNNNNNENKQKKSVLNKCFSVISIDNQNNESTVKGVEKRNSSNLQSLLGQVQQQTIQQPNEIEEFPIVFEKYFNINKNNMFIYDFDVGYIFEGYFVNNNIPVVLFQFEKFQKASQKIKQKNYLQSTLSKKKNVFNLKGIAKMQSSVKKQIKKTQKNKYDFQKQLINDK